MGNENGEWIMYGIDEDDPYRIKSVPELISYINEIGFLPLFKNTIPGFSVEERTLAGNRWIGRTQIRYLTSWLCLPAEPFFWFAIRFFGQPRM